MNKTNQYDFIYWLLAAFAVFLLFTAFQSSQEDKAKCQQTQSVETCEYYIH